MRLEKSLFFNMFESGSGVARTEKGRKAGQPCANLSKFEHNHT